MIINQRKSVWVEVEVEQRLGEQTPRLINSIDPTRALEALRDLRSFKPGYGPSELFNETNPFFSPRRTIVSVAEAHGVSGEDLINELTESCNKTYDKDITLSEERRRRLKALTKQSILRQYTHTDEFHDEDEPRLAFAAKRVGISTDQYLTEMKGDLDAPFFSEAYLYTLVGKDIARSILVRLSELESALGYRQEWMDKISEQQKQALSKLTEEEIIALHLEDIWDKTRE